MSESLQLFPYIDIAMRAVAVLILCALPVLLLPLPSRDAPVQRAIRARDPVTSD